MTVKAGRIPNLTRLAEVLLALTKQTSGLLIYILQLDRTQPFEATLSVGICRMGIFGSMLWVYFVLMNALGGGNIVAYAQMAQGAPHYSFGLLKILPMPSPAMWGFIAAMALVSCIMAIVGLCTRPAMIVATVTTLLLATYDAGRLPFWSAPYNVVFLAGLAFMFGRADVSLSVDAKIKDYWRRYPFGAIASSQSYLLAWPILLAQTSVALFYFAAFYSKLYTSGLHYIFSDGMRFALAATWTAPKEFIVPWYIQWLWNSQTLWTFAIIGHLLMQALPITAVFTPRIPRARLIEAVIFVGGMIGIREFMTVWNPWWILLAPLFIDWDHFFRAAGNAQPIRLPTPQWPAAGTARRAAVLSAVFLGYYLIVILGMRGRVDLNYPFDNFDMYSSIYADTPYSEHLPFRLFYGDVTMRTKDCEISEGRWINVTGKSWEVLDKIYSPISRKATVHDPIFYRCRQGRSRITNLPDNFFVDGHIETPVENYRKSLHAIRAFLSPVPDDAELRLWGEIVVYPAYPKAPWPHTGFKALRGILRSDGSFIGARGDVTYGAGLKSAVLDIQQEGFSSTKWAIRYVHSVWSSGKPEKPKPLPGHWVMGKYQFDPRVAPSPYSIVMDTEDPRTGEKLEFYGPYIDAD